MAIAPAPHLTEPVTVHEGLAVYRRGSGPPLLLLPYPHASGGGPMVDGALADLLVDAGHEVVTFDPPGQHRSTRAARGDLAEMLACAEETRRVQGLPEQVVVVGHSMSALCALFHAIDAPDRVERLVLVGTPPGSGWSILRYRALPFHWPPWHPDLWRMIWWGVLLATGRGSLATHKRMDALLERANLADASRASPPSIEPGDRHRSAPPRDRWWLTIRHVRTVPVADRVRCPTLLLVGRHDPQTPPRVSRALQRRIPGSRLVVFEHSGHSPFVEEPLRFTEALAEFLD